MGFEVEYVLLVLARVIADKGDKYLQAALILRDRWNATGIASTQCEGYQARAVGMQSDIPEVKATSSTPSQPQIKQAALLRHGSAVACAAWVD